MILLRTIVLRAEDNGGLRGGKGECGYDQWSESRMAG
jgi:hypothetical protein